MSRIRRRDLLTGAALALAGGAPSYAGQLDDAQVAAVATYVRNSWGHTAGTVPAAAAHDARESPSTNGP